MELQQRLQTALGDTYRIQRELGGGGMSRVFLAEETGSAARSSSRSCRPRRRRGQPRRFRREIQLAARLQHPHIVPLLAAGAAGDLLYYVMPFIEGESLRAQLSREGELPVTEAVRILREVADALAYAHASGVVHRDIKPDNMMLSGRHALVTDFGVAKAVSESSGHASLTSAASPSARRPTWRRSRPPPIPTSTIAPISTRWAPWRTRCSAGVRRSPASRRRRCWPRTSPRRPSRCSSRRPAVPPALNAIVMRCLEKRPADRWQTAEELLAALEPSARRAAA